MPVDVDWSVLWAYSAHGSRELQDDGLSATRLLRDASSSWLTLSVCPLDWGWNPDVRLAVAPMSLQKARHTREEN